MKWGIILAVAGSLLLVGCGPSLQSERRGKRPAPQVQPIPEDLRGAISDAEAYGAAIYLQDKASALATDALVDEIGPLIDHKDELAGWLTAQEGDSAGNPKDAYLTEFMSREEPPRVVYRIRVPTLPGVAPAVEKVLPPADLDAGRLILWRARQTAVASLQSTPQPLNPVVLPGPTGSVYVYLLAGTTKSNVAVLGQHHRIRISEENGTTVLESLAMSKTLIEEPLSRSAGADIPEGAKLKALVVTHLVTEYPMETHVFASLLYKLPVFVGTSRGMWQVIDGKISYLGPLNQTPDKSATR